MGEKDKAQALHDFWSSFGWLAIDEQSAYDEGVMEEWGNPNKYITYEAAVSELDEPISLSADLWHRSTSWADIEAKAQEVISEIGYGGKLVPYDGGAIWIKRSAPAYQRMSAENSFDIRRIHININAEFLSA